MGLHRAVCPEALPQGVQKLDVPAAVLGGHQEQVLPRPHAVEVDDQTACGVGVLLPKGGGPQEVALVVVQKDQTHPLVPLHRLRDGKQGQYAGGVAVGVKFVCRTVGREAQERHG